jgi:hypothetical protein
VTSYVYQRSEPTLWTVGYYTPSGRWEADSDHGSPAEAAESVAWLNGTTDHLHAGRDDRERLLRERLAAFLVGDVRAIELTDAEHEYVDATIGDRELSAAIGHLYLRAAARIVLTATLEGEQPETTVKS